MQANSDLTELLAALNAEGAKYLIVGAYAVGLHGRPHATKDADLFSAATQATRNEFGMRLRVSVRRSPA